MNDVQAYEAVRQALKPRRFEHTERVTEEAIKLVGMYGGDLDKVRLAAILHDYAKYRSVTEMREEVMKNSRLPNRLLEYGDELLHSFVGSIYVEKELNVDDETILSAIRFHTTGRARMTVEEKIIFLADYIEPGRAFPKVTYVREVANKDLDEACLYALKNTIQFLSERNVAIYPDTFEAYNDLILNRNQSGGHNENGN